MTASASDAVAAALGLHQDGDRSQTPRSPSRPESVVVGLFGAVASQVALATALLYYVGWARSHATLGYFGIDPALVGYSTADYVLRSLSAAFAPVIVVTLVGLGLLLLHRNVVKPRVHGGGRFVRRVLVVGFVLAGVLAAVVCVRLVLPDWLPIPRGLMLPVSLLLAAGSIAYLDHLWTLSRPNDPSAESPTRARALALLGVVLLSGLWSLAVYAQGVGEKRAERIVAGLRAAPAITVYSTSPLAIHGLGVQKAKIGVDGDRYRHAYTGLRLLTAGNGKTVLLPVGWRRGESVFVLSDDESVRIDVAARQTTQ